MADVNINPDNPVINSRSFGEDPKRVADKVIAYAAGLEDGLLGSPHSSRDSQEPSSTPQFKSINSSALSFLDSPTLTSIHDYWKSHSFDLEELVKLGVL